MSQTKAIHTPGLAAKLDQWLSSDEEDVPYPKVERGQFEVVTERSGQRNFWFVCPGKCGTLAPIALRPVVNGSPQSWEFDGNTEAPTLQPSINHVGCWHGWLTGGVFTEC